MTLVQLANFIRIAELQSVSKAAAVVRIAQPALSRQVRSLEIELGSSLLVRRPWGVTLTPAGEVLVSRGRRLLVDAENIRDAVADLSSEPRGRIAVGVPTSLAVALIPPLATIVRDRYPGLRPHFVDGFSAMLHGRTMAGDLDLAVLYEDRAKAPLATAPLLTEALMMIGPRGAKPSGRSMAAVIRNKTLILPARPNRLRLIVDEALAKHAGLEFLTVEVDSLPAIVGMVAVGLGFTFLPYSSVAAEVASGSVEAWNLPSPRFHARCCSRARWIARRPRR